MKLKRTRIQLPAEVQESTPLFYRYIDAINRDETSGTEMLLQSKLYQSFSVIEAPSKLISSIIDYSIIKK